VSDIIYGTMMKSYLCHVDILDNGSHSALEN
jgi:hypothetical protein